MNKRFVLGIDLNFLDQSDHVNKMPFSGIAGFVDTPTDGSPGGAGGMKVVFERQAVQKALSTFPGMGVNCVWDDGYWSDPEYALTGHDDRFKVGVISAADVTGNDINISGYLWKYDFSDVCFMVQNTKESLGFSVEVLINAAEEREGVIYATDITFLGVAILYKDLAAFKQTKIAAAAAKKRSDQMNKEEIQALIDAAIAGVTTEFEGKIEAANALVAGANEALSAMGEGLKEASEKVEALTVQLAEANEKLGGMDAMAAENAELKEKLGAMEVDLAAVKDGKLDKPQRKTMQFSTLAKYEAAEGEDPKDLKVVCSEIAADQSLSESQKWQLKLEAWRKSIEK